MPVVSILCFRSLCADGRALTVNLYHKKSYTATADVPDATSITAVARDLVIALRNGWLA